MQDNAAAPDALTLRRWAAEAAVDERTMRKRLRGEPVKGMAAGRADEVLRKHGIEPGALAEGARP